MTEAATPLPLPEGFDPDVNLVARVTENGIFHESRRGARLAQQLVASGTPQDLQLAEKVLDAVLFAVLSLTCTTLGRNAPIRLAVVQDDLVLELYNYLGPEKRFWELNWPGAFYKGTSQCGFYLEVAERATYPDGKAFGEKVRHRSLAVIWHHKED